MDERNLESQLLRLKARLMKDVDELLDKKLENVAANIVDETIQQHSELFNEKELKDLLWTLEHPESEMLHQYFITKLKYVLE